MDNVIKLSDIEAKPVRRNRTWFVELDWIYGYSTFPDRTEWGMPKGKISLWAGIAGVGKSRLCIEVAKQFSLNYSNGVVLYFQTESSLDDFASWAKNTTEYDKIYCSGESRIDEIIKIIYEVKPKLVFIDSVNEIDEFENGNKKEARRLIKGIDGKTGLKKVIHDIGAHLILLGQLNQDGKTIKGGTSLPHLVDIALDIVPAELGSDFIVRVGTKHRHGKKGTQTLFTHTDIGVSNNSHNRILDQTWRDVHGMGAYVPPPSDPSPSNIKHVYIPGEKTWEDEWLEPSLYTRIGNFFGDLFGT